jgi:hypothetical protein
MMDIMFQCDEFVNSTLEVCAIFKLSFEVKQGLLKCVASNSFGNGSDEIKLYITGKTWSIEFSNFDTLKSEYNI